MTPSSEGMARERDWRLEICKIVSQMLDSPDRIGIYSTTECYDRLENLVYQARREALEEAAKVAEQHEQYTEMRIAQAIRSLIK